MSRLRLTKVATPSNPAANKGELFYSSTLSPAALAFIDESGNILRFGGLTTQDYRLIKVTHILQGTTSYTPTSGARALFVECIGAGASGGGGGSTAVSAALGAGGGGGAYSSLWTTTIKAFTVQVGAGGSAPSAGNNPGNAGTDTTFDSPSICTAKGGAAGPAGGAGATTIGFIIGGAGGLASSGVGDDKLAGTSGGCSIRQTGLIGMSGRGGDGPLAGGGGIEVVAQGSGIAGTGFGSGGSGGCTLNGGATTAGGAGANGLIRVWEFA